MKLTPLDIQQQQFPRAISGYSIKEVQVYLEFLGREYQALLTEVGGGQDRVRVLEEEVFRYKEREETLKEALVSAQRMAEDMRTAAKKEADLVLAEAEMKAERIIHHAHSRLIAILEEISDLKRQRIQLVESLRQVLATHQKLIEHDEGLAREQDEAVTYLKTSVTSKKAVSGGASEALPAPELPPGAGRERKG